MLGRAAHASNRRRCASRAPRRDHGESNFAAAPERPEARSATATASSRARPNRTPEAARTPPRRLRGEARPARPRPSSWVAPRCEVALGATRAASSSKSTACRSHSATAPGPGSPRASSAAVSVRRSRPQLACVVAKQVDLGSADHGLTTLTGLQYARHRARRRPSPRVLQTRPNAASPRSLGPPRRRRIAGRGAGRREPAARRQRQKSDAG